MKTSVVILTGGAAYTDIPCTIPAHHVRVSELGAAPVGLTAKFPDDAYATARIYDEGKVVHRSGNGQHGIVARPTNYNASGEPATADLYMKLKATNDANDIKVLLEEFQTGEDEEF